MNRLLDTDTCIGVLRASPGMVDRLRAQAPAGCAVSSVTVYELLSGVEKAREPARERSKAIRFLSQIREIPFDHTAGANAAKVRADLERKGMTIGPYDLLIAGQALSSGLILVTGNAGEFLRVEGLRVESWP